jgi:hypothetical protein
MAFDKVIFDEVINPRLAYRFGFNFGFSFGLIQSLDLE